MELSSEKKKMIIKTIEIRLDEIGEATKRAKITFIIAIIISCAMLITLWNTYHSWTGARAFDKTFKFETDKVTDETEFFNKLKNTHDKFQHFRKSIEEYKSIDNRIISVEDLVKEYDALNQVTQNIQKKTLGTADEVLKKQDEELKKQKDVYESKLKNFLNTINVKILADEKFYDFDNLTFYSLFYKDEASEVDEKTKTQKADELKKIIKKNILNEQTLAFYNGTNHLNAFILEKLFPELHWETLNPALKQAPLPLYEHNKRVVAGEWIENHDINIGLLGVRVNVDQFSLLGSFALMIISFWMLFSFRRENRSIASLLRDVKDEVKYPNGKSEKNDAWDIANLTFHGIVHKLIFAHTGKTDKPMSKQDIFRGEYTPLGDFLNNYVAILTKVIRAFSLFLLFLPVIATVLIIFDDINTTKISISPFVINPARSLIQNNIEPLGDQITYEIWIGSFFGLITSLGCTACLVFQIRTTQSLREYEKSLYPNKLNNQEDSSTEETRESENDNEADSIDKPKSP